MATRKTNTKSTKSPSKPKAPAKPVARKAATSRQPKAKAIAAASAKPRTPKVVEPKHDPQLLKELESLKTQVAKQTEIIENLKAKASRLPRNARSVEQILENARFVKNDWREDYQGFRLALHAFDANSRGKFEIHEDEVINGMLALPRDTDVGGQGPAMRSSGMIAVHWQAGETLDDDGNPTFYAGKPGYVTQEELAEIWAEE